MKEVKYKNNHLEMEDSIDEIIIVPFQAYNRSVMIDEGIGSDLDSVSTRINTIRSFNASGDKESVDKELLNLQTNISFIVNNASPKMNSFVALIRKMNGKPLPDNYDAAKIIKELSKGGLTIGKVNGYLNEVKKNLKFRWKCFFHIFQTVQEPKSVMQS